GAGLCPVRGRVCERTWPRPGRGIASPEAGASLRAREPPAPRVPQLAEVQGRASRVRGGVGPRSAGRARRAADMTAPGTQMLEGLRLLKDMPGWLSQDRLERAMRKCVPEFTSGAMTLLEARAKRIRFERASATGWFMATVEGSGGT